jgi:copper chaperone CopZ
MNQEIIFQINGMHCVACANLIERELKKVPGIQKAAVNFVGQKARLSFDEERVTIANIQQALEAAGDYHVIDLNGV